MFYLRGGSPRPADVVTRKRTRFLASVSKQPLPLSPIGQPVSSFPSGAPASPAWVLQIGPDDIARLKAGRFKAAIAMQALDTPWNSLQVEAIARTMAEYDIEVVAVTDAAQVCLPETRSDS